MFCRNPNVESGIYFDLGYVRTIASMLVPTSYFAIAKTVVGNTFPAKKNYTSFKPFNGTRFVFIRWLKSLARWNYENTFFLTVFTISQYVFTATAQSRRQTLRKNLNANLTNPIFVFRHFFFLFTKIALAQLLKNGVVSTRLFNSFTPNLEDRRTSGTDVCR